MEVVEKKLLRTYGAIRHGHAAYRGGTDAQGVPTMKRLALLVALTAMFCMVADADAGQNGNGKFGLHFAGPHDSKVNTCESLDLQGECSNMVVSSSDNPLARYDVYVVAIDTGALTAARYGLACDGDFYFYGWTNCTLLELPSENWPGCGEANAHSMGTPVPGPITVLGILDVYTYGTSVSISTTTDARTGFGEWCDDTEPNPVCDKTTDPLSFGTVGFNSNPGVNNCGIIPVEHPTWGKVKTLYR